MIKNIATKWRSLSGNENWKNLLDPLNIDLHQYIIHYGERAQATYDTFNNEKASKYEGSSKYAMKNLFANVGLEIANPYKYKPTKYVYATSQIQVPQSFIVRPTAKGALCKESNWMGYVAVATDEGKLVLGRRDILIAWRGTLQPLEWVKDFEFPLVSASTLFGNECKAKVHHGFLSVYTSSNQTSPYNKTSARDQVLSEVKRLVDIYKEEEISITITGHSLGAAIGTLNAADIVTKGLNKPEGNMNKLCPVTAFLFASPRVGDSNFGNMVLEMNSLHLLRVTNALDAIPHVPTIPFIHVGEELMIDTQKSNYLKKFTNLLGAHNLEGYLHGVAGTQGTAGGFKLEVKRPIELVNKKLGIVKNEYSVPVAWWVMKNKGMTQLKDGSWKLDDHEKDDVEP